MSQNQLTGTIPIGFGNLVQMSGLYVSRISVCFDYLFIWYIFYPAIWIIINWREPSQVLLTRWIFSNVCMFLDPSEWNIELNVNFLLHSYLNNNQLSGIIPHSVCTIQISDLSLNDWSCPFPNCCSISTCGICTNTTSSPPSNVSLLCCTYLTSSSTLQSFCYKGVSCPPPAQGYTFWSSASISSCSQCAGQQNDLHSSYFPDSSLKAYQQQPFKQSPPRK